MQNFIVKTGKLNDDPWNFHFFVLNKGLNSGKPLSHACLNCFKVKAVNLEIKKTLYWITFFLWKVKAFHPYLIGSVIPFIRIGIYRQIICKKLEIVMEGPEKFKDALKCLQFIEAKEKQFIQNLKLIRELKRAYAYKCFHQNH